jgi:hypothetical protein
VGPVVTLATPPPASSVEPRAPALDGALDRAFDGRRRQVALKILRHLAFDA